MSRGQAKSAKPRSSAMVVTTWVSSLLALGLLLLSATAVKSDLGALRPCSANNGLTVTNCGKQSLNLGDLMLLTLLVLSACLVVMLCTAAWRVSRRRKAS